MQGCIHHEFNAAGKRVHLSGVGNSLDCGPAPLPLLTVHHSMESSAVLGERRGDRGTEGGRGGRVEQQARWE